MKTLSHLDKNGHAHMVDVGEKPLTHRQAKARGVIRVSPVVARLLKAKKIPKGDVFTTAQLAGIMAAKKTHELIPLCHPLILENIQIHFQWRSNNVVITTDVSSRGKTGVEMEALTAATVAALTIYDMCKAVDKGVVIGPVVLLEKSGGRSGTYTTKESTLKRT